MTYNIVVEKRVVKEINSLPKADAIRVTKAINNLSEQPRPYGCLKLENEDNLYRVRVGDYRIIYSIYDNELTVLVVKVSHRRDAYRGEL